MLDDAVARIKHEEGLGQSDISVHNPRAWFLGGDTHSHTHTLAWRSCGDLIEQRRQWTLAADTRNQFGHQGGFEDNCISLTGLSSVELKKTRAKQDCDATVSVS